MPAALSLTAAGRAAIAAAVMLLPLAAAAAQPTLAERGYQRAAGDCATCHAMDAKRDSPNPGAPPFPDIGRRFPDNAALSARVRQVARQGHYAMPPRALSSKDRSAIVAYMRAAADHAWRD